MRRNYNSVHLVLVLLAIHLSVSVFVLVLIVPGFVRRSGCHNITYATIVAVSESESIHIVPHYDYTVCYEDNNVTKRVSIRNSMYKFSVGDYVRLLYSDNECYYTFCGQE